MKLKSTKMFGLRWLDKRTRIKREDASKRPWEYRHMDRVLSEFELTSLNKWGIKWHDISLGQTKDIFSLQNKFSGDCFIVGTGPSVNEADFARLRNHSCFGVNGAIIEFEKYEFPPDFYVITTYDFFDKRSELVRQVLRSGAKCFFPFYGIGKICEKMENLLPVSEIYLTDPLNQRYNVPRQRARLFLQYAKQDDDFILHHNYKKYRKALDKVGFSKNLTKGYFHGENVVYTALQHAFYLGFRRIFILGMDLNYSGGLVRFYEKKEEARPNWLDLSYNRSILPCFEIVHDMMKKGLIEVYNVSLDSRLPEIVIPKISFNEALEFCDEK